MKISELGEFGLIERVAKVIAAAGVGSTRDVILGIGDDAAAWRRRSGLELATTDTLVQGVHFDIPPATWRELGWKALAVNISDLAAMGGAPEYALVTLGLPVSVEVEWVVQLYEGMAESAREYGCAIVGGDMARAREIFVTVSLAGSARKLMTRSAAKPGDLIAVTGCLGSAAAGLRMLQKGLNFDEETTRFLREAHFKPEPRVREGQLLVEKGVKAAIDVSDGLVADLGHLCQASGVGARVRIDKVPVHPLVESTFGPDRSRKMALTGGEDYVLLFAAPAQVMDAVKEALAGKSRQALATIPMIVPFAPREREQLSHEIAVVPARKDPCTLLPETGEYLPVAIIGEVTEGTGVTVLDRSGKPIVWRGGGWDHFLDGGR
ncbi:MAG: thiamine-phosphate kinase [Chloroflexi bacterium]|nr:thiamine-phosphate kinase [Chloroflexota bacterium]